MHSNFITPPDYVETILILDATEEQINLLGPVVQNKDIPYNVYFYTEEMNDPAWFAKISNKADVILDAKITNIQDYFNK